MQECEDAVGCVTWMFQGTDGQGRWPTGAVGDLTLETFNDNTVLIRRTDHTGTAKGLTAVYTATRNGNRLEGTLTWSWPKHGIFSSGRNKWHATMNLPQTASNTAVPPVAPSNTSANPAEPSSEKLPNGMHECETGVGCVAWNFDGKTGTGHWRHGAVAELTIERLDASGATIRRVDTTGAMKGLTATYEATRKGDLLEGTVKWSWPGHGAQSSGINTWNALILRPPDPAHVALKGEEPKPIPVKSNVESTPLLAIEQPQPKLIVPQPSVTWKAKSAPPVGFDLNGIWQREVGTPGTAGYRQEEISIYQLRSSVRMINLEGREFIRPNSAFLNGAFNTPGTIEAKIYQADNPPTKMAAADITVDVDDTDHIRIGKIEAFHRVSRATVKDLPCNPSNPLRTSAQDAYNRGMAYLGLNDATTANCWFYVSAVQGEARAQVNYGHSLLLGEGIGKNPEQAFFWFQQAAMQGEALGELNVSAMMAAGVGTAKNEDKAWYWKHRYDTHPDETPYDPKAPPQPQWALATSEPCNLNNPKHVKADEAFSKAEVAVNADAIPLANCWYSVSAQQGYARANVKLGLNYAVGAGVPKRPDIAFAYMQRAADEGDP